MCREGLPGVTVLPRLPHCVKQVFSAGPPQCHVASFYSGPARVFQVSPGPRFWFLEIAVPASAWGLHGSVQILSPEQMLEGPSIVASLLCGLQDSAVGAWRCWLWCLSADLCGME